MTARTWSGVIPKLSPAQITGDAAGCTFFDDGEQDEANAQATKTAPTATLKTRTLVPARLAGPISW